jgi:branched-chain amino acid transport system permease protein
LELWQVVLQNIFGGIGSGAIYSLIGVGFIIIFRTSGVVNFAQGEFLMLGSLISVSLYEQAHLPLPIACLAAIVVVAIIAGLVYRVVLVPAKKPKTLAEELVVYFIIMLGISIFLRVLALIIWGKERYVLPAFFGTVPFEVYGAFILPQTIVVIIAAALVVTGLFMFLKLTLMGKALRAVTSDKWAASLVGINTIRITTIAFALGGAVGAAGGIIIVPLAYADFNMGVVFGLKGFVAGAISGLNSIPLTVVGGLLLGVVESLVAGLISSTYKNIAAFGILLITVTAYAWILRRKAGLR